MSSSRIVIPLLAIILLSSLVYGRLDDEEAKCNIHYNRNPNHLQKADSCEHHGHYFNMCNKVQCYKGLGESCASRDDEWGQVKHGKCKEPLTCGSCGQCEGCLDMIINGKSPCHECPMKLKYTSHDNTILNEFKRNPKFTNYDYYNNYEQPSEY